MNKHQILYKLMSMQKEIYFDKEFHKYFVRGEPFVSVTQRISLFENKTDFAQIAKDVVENKRSKYFERNSDEVLKEWEAKRDVAGIKGTAVHKFAELMSVGLKKEISEKERKQYHDYYWQLDHFFITQKLDIVMPEVIVYDERAKVAGTIDLLSYNSDGTLTIWDWKTNEGELTVLGNGEFFNKPLDDVPYTKYWSYCLQLQTYKKILQNMGIEVKAANIVHLNKEVTILPTMNLEKQSTLLLYENVLLKN